MALYVPPHFAESRSDEALRIIREHPLGTLVVQGAEGPDAVHVPFLFDPAAGVQGLLQAHVARGNPVCAAQRDGEPVLVVFHGLQAYVSPNWYPSKQQTHRQVPTWNYQVVHVHGTLRIRDDERFKRGLLARLTRAHEEGMAAPRPWKMGDAPADYIDAMLAAIVGIEVEVRRMSTVSKLSQNKQAEDRAGVVAGMRGLGREDMATAIEQAAPRG